MSTVLIIAPIVISNWPAITVAAVGAASALGLVVKQNAKEMLEDHVDDQSVEVEMASSQVMGQNLANEQEIVVAKGEINITIKRDARGRCVICAHGKRSKIELEQAAKEFSQKFTQVFVYNKVMTELRAKGMKISNEEVLKDKSIRINIRHQVD